MRTSILDKVIITFSSEEQEKLSKELSVPISMIPADVTLKNMPSNLFDKWWYNEDKILYNKLKKLQNYVYRYLPILPTYPRGEHQKNINFIVSRCHLIILSRYHYAVMPTLIEAEEIFKLLTKSIIKDPTLPSQYYIVRKTLYKYIKLLKGDKHGQQSK